MNRLENSCATRLFSAKVFREIACQGNSPLFGRLVHQSGLLEFLPNDSTVEDVFEIALEKLNQEQSRAEYIYKAAITKNILMGRHSLNTACMLSEFRVDQSKADVVILNGTSTVYEIKSEKDNLSRLPNQIAAYRKVFPDVNVISASAHLERIADIVPTDVGLMTLTRNRQISIKRKSVSNVNKLSPDVIFGTLRTREAEYVLKHHHFEIPSIPNTKKYAYLKSKFTGLSPDQAHVGMTAALKKFRSHVPVASFINSVPNSVRTLAATTKLRACDRERFISAMKQPYDVAATWG